VETEKEDTGDRGPEKFQRQEALGDVRKGPTVDERQKYRDNGKRKPLET
jgi:hypothetical protein